MQQQARESGKERGWRGIVLGGVERFEDLTTGERGRENSQKSEGESWRRERGWAAAVKVSKFPLEFTLIYYPPHPNTHSVDMNN